MTASSVPRFLAVTALLGASFGVGVASASAERVVPSSAPNHPLTRVAWPSAFRSDSTGLYTVEQAKRGEEVFYGVCYECHEVEDLNNEDFRLEWEGRSAWELYDLVRTTMPDENPGTLTREQYLDAIAYVLKINNQPAGPEEFVGDSAKASAFILRLSASADSAAAPDTTVKPDTGAAPDTMVAPDTTVAPDTGAVAGDAAAYRSAAVRGLFR